MENQYNYYHSEEPQNDSSYSSQPNPEHHEKPKKKMPKAVVVTGCALLFGVVSSATFLTTNVVGNKVLGLDQKAAKEVSNTTQNKATLTKTSSVVTSDVSSGICDAINCIHHKYECSAGAELLWRNLPAGSDQCRNRNYH